MDDVRLALEHLIKGRGESYAALSQLLGRNPAYLQQFVKRGSPRRLEEQDRRTLARYFGVDEVVLGGEVSTVADCSDVIRVPRLAVQVSAGTGSLVEGEIAIGSHWFDKKWLRQVSRAEAGELSIITVVGDSMTPTLSDGDDVLVDQSSSRAKLRDGIYVMRRDDTFIVKRLTMDPTSGMLTISSDNPAYPTFHNCLPGSVAVLGRVVWIGRKLA